MSLVENEPFPSNEAMKERINARKRADAKLQLVRLERARRWAEFFKADGDLVFVVLGSEALAAPIPDEKDELDMQATVDFFKRAFEHPMWIGDPEGNGNGGPSPDNSIKHDSQGQ